MKARILVLKSVRMLVRIALAGSGLILVVGAAHATDISGTISSTLVIMEDSQLVGNVTCTVVGAPCIQFGASDITLKLNGFTMTGLADPITGCKGNSDFPEIGIATAGQSDLEIEGPGLVQRFREAGVEINQGSTKVKVKKVTASTNCISGIALVDKASDNVVEENVSVRNGSAVFAFCGGIEIFESNNNRIRRNVTSGNGFANPPGRFVNAGIGVGFSNGNLIEENTVDGNTNGIVIFRSSGNVVRRNVVAGNPPIQVHVIFPTFASGNDIRNVLSTTTFEDNLCVTSLNAPCPNFPAGVGHKNGDEAER